MLVTLVGAGSFDFNGPLLRALLPVAARRNLTIGLCDVDPAALDEMAGIAGRLADELGVSVPVERFSRLEEAVAEAAFVTLTLNHGGLRGDLGDYQNALDHGYLPKHVDTIGPAG
ncbi:MAG: hypothetical protein HUU35_20425, partial [Armatimonadetes bacterium]|nr:hypothetical protein [Armatimonadota bacterium]